MKIKCAVLACFEVIAFIFAVVGVAFLVSRVEFVGVIFSIIFLSVLVFGLWYGLYLLCVDHHEKPDYSQVWIDGHKWED